MQKIELIRNAIQHCDKPDGFTSKDLHAIFGTNRKKDILQMSDEEILKLTETIFDNRSFHSGDLVTIGNEKAYAIVMHCSYTEDKMWVVRKKDLLPMFVNKSDCVNTGTRNHLDIAFSTRRVNMFGFCKGDIVREVKNRGNDDYHGCSRFDYGEVIDVTNSNFVLVKALHKHHHEERYLEADTGLWNYRHIEHLDKEKQAKTEEMWKRYRMF